MSNVDAPETTPTVNPARAELEAFVKKHRDLFVKAARRERKVYGKGKRLDFLVEQAQERFIKHYLGGDL